MLHHGSIIVRLKVFLINKSELSAQLPQIDLQPTDPNMDQHKVTREKLIALLAKVDEMRQQRAQLLTRLQLSLKDDDPTQIIAANQNDINPQAFFAQNLQKHSQLTQYIQQNLLAQENILRALAECNASYAQERQRLTGASQERTNMIDRLVGSYQRVDELCEKGRKGVSYFETLAREPLRDLIKDVKEFCEWSKKQKQSVAATKRPMQPPRLPVKPNEMRSNGLIKYFRTIEGFI